MRGGVGIVVGVLVAFVCVAELDLQSPICCSIRLSSVIASLVIVLLDSLSLLLNSSSRASFHVGILAFAIIFNSRRADAGVYFKLFS